jgi:uncharacterized protein (TIGR00369 family)
MPTVWEDNHMCFCCGGKNPVGLKLEFTAFGDDGLQTTFTPTAVYQGYKDIVHGGFLAMLMDEVIANLPWKRQKQAVVTAEITVRLHQPAPIGQTLTVVALPDGEPHGRFVPIRAEVRLPDGRVAASARAKCIKVTIGPGR